jgi:DNA-directed RNA polymerase subunit RPC12/RpoP
MLRDENPSPQYLHPYACFQCRKSFRRASRPEAVLSCPHCGGPSIGLNRKFKAPKRSDVKQWHKVESLVRCGFLFESVGEPYPAEIGEVDAFAQKHAAYLQLQRRRHAEIYAVIEAALNERVNL